jgi:hypothetical protein
MYVYVYRWQMRIYGSRALRHTAWLARHLAVKRAKVSWPRAKGKFGMISGIRDAEFDRELHHSNSSIRDSPSGCMVV